MWQHVPSGQLVPGFPPATYSGGQHMACIPPASVTWPFVSTMQASSRGGCSCASGSFASKVAQPVPRSERAKRTRMALIVRCSRALHPDATPTAADSPGDPHRTNAQARCFSRRTPEARRGSWKRIAQRSMGDHRPPGLASRRASRASRQSVATVLTGPRADRPRWYQCGPRLSLSGCRLTICSKYASGVGRGISPPSKERSVACS
jgi:hypothetical protein